MPTLQHSNGRKVEVPEDTVDYYLEKGWSRLGEQPAVTIPEGDPNESWKIAVLQAYAAQHHIDLGSAKVKADMLAAIEAAKQASPEPPAPAAPDGAPAEQQPAAPAPAEGVNGGTDTGAAAAVPAAADGGAANPS